MTKIGTLAELNVKPGDVVEFQGGARPIYTIGVSIYGKLIDVDDGEELCEYMPFRIVSRASDKPKLWRDMTPEEKGALLLAHHEGKVIEWTGHFGSEFDMDSIRGTPVWSDTHAYRIKTRPKVETVNQGYKTNSSGRFVTTSSLDHATHVVTFNLINGEPDCTSIKMERLQ